MKLLIPLTGTFLLGLLAHWLMDWYGIVLAGACWGLLATGRGRWTIAAVFAGAALLWGGYAAWLDLANQSLLSERIGTLFGGLPAVLLVLLSALTGGLYAACGALTGLLARRAIGRS